MLSLGQRIRALYQANPNISAQEIIQRLGVKPTRDFWRILNAEQVGIRGLSPDRRKNGDSFTIHIPRKSTPWIEER